MQIWTTVDRPAAEQFSYWREVICAAFAPLAAQRTAAHRSTGPAEPGITGRVQARALTETNCAEISSRTQLITHGEAEVRRTRSEQVFVNLQIRGLCRATQDGRKCVVQPGAFALFDTTRPYRLEFIEDSTRYEWSAVSFRVPRANLLPLLADPMGFTSIAYSATGGGVANLVASTMMSIWRNLPDLRGGEADAAETAFTTMLAAGLGCGEELRDTRRETVDVTLRATINRYIATNLRTADLSAPQVARRFGVSVRKLHSLYQGTDRSFAQTVMALRVEACARELASAENWRSLTETATRWGFYDLSHLNRVFRQYRGCLPSEYRDACVRPALEVPGMTPRPRMIHGTGEIAR